ncbi:hypothetical protein O3M35_005578 [Rhynocoris fuscipes]|uniref:C2H2-type domain-containing protein n=1 Tax=Rhynocoris fuscipes TaxID=488301 RepID=A0AAW1DKW2_9HEMI
MSRNMIYDSELVKQHIKKESSAVASTKRKPGENLKLKIHCIVGTSGHKFYQVSSDDSHSRSKMDEHSDKDEHSAENDETKLINKNQENEEDKATESSGEDMDSAETFEVSETKAAVEKNENGSATSTPLSNGSKETLEVNSGTKLTQNTTEDEDEENNTGDSGVSSPGDSKKDVMVKSPIAKEVKREPKSPGGSDISDAPAEQVQPILRVRRDDDLFEKVPFENIDNLVQQPKQEATDELYMCSVCPERFSSGTALETHMASTGHYSVAVTPEPPPAPQAVQGPMQQLAQQVQRIPASFNSQPYRSDQQAPPPPPSSQMYSQNAYSQRLNMLGSQVKLTPVGASTPPPSSSLPNLPPGIQLQKRPAQQNIDNSQPKQRREEIPSNPSLKLPSSITLVRPSQPAPPPKKDNSVVDILANRGITMIPSGAKAPPSRATNRIPVTPGTVSQLNSSVSITPSARSQQQAYGGRGLPTVDLTSDPDLATHHPMQQTSHQQPQRMRNRVPPGMTPPHGRPPMRVSCQVCDKVFPSQEALNQHLPSHRGIHNKLPFECKECTAQYPTAQGLAVHKQKYHHKPPPQQPQSSSILDFAIPVVDLKQNGVLHKLTSLGVRNFIPLAQLHNQQNTGQFGLPIISVELANNPAFCNINGVGASNLLLLGPLKNLPH